MSLQCVEYSSLGSKDGWETLKLVSIITAIVIIDINHVGGRLSKLGSLFGYPK